MKYFEEKLEDKYELTRINRAQAKKMYEDGIDIFFKLGDSRWLKANIADEDEENPFTIPYAVDHYAEVNNVVIICDNKSVIRYLKNIGIDGKVLQSATQSDIKGKIVYKFGIPLSLRMACLCKVYYDVQYKDVNFKKSGIVMKRYIVKEGN